MYPTNAFNWKLVLRRYYRNGLQEKTGGAGLTAVLDVSAGLTAALIILCSCAFRSGAFIIKCII